MLIQLQKISKQQHSDLKILHAQCKQSDGNSVPIYDYLLEEDRVLPSTFLYYQQDQLVGFLSAFFFYDNACEISLMVAPNHRRKGIAGELLRALLPLMESQEMDTLIFSMLPGADVARLNQPGFQYSSSEYQMLRNDPQPINGDMHGLGIRSAQEEDIPALCLLDFLCFPDQRNNMEKRFRDILHDPQFSIFVAELNGSVIGKAHINWHEQNARLTDIAIKPDLQGKGLGTSLMIYCINHAVKAGQVNLLLDVETSNQNALRLYTNLGFFSVNSCDFWAISRQNFAQFT